MVVNIPKNIGVFNLIKVIFALYLLYIIFKIVQKELGGSWGFEALIIALIIANLGYSFIINAQLQRHLGKHSVFDKQFSSFAKDFKEFKNKKLR